MMSARVAFSRGNVLNAQEVHAASREAAHAFGKVYMWLSETTLLSSYYKVSKITVVQKVGS